MRFDHLAVDRRFDYMSDTLTQRGWQRARFEDGEAADVLILPFPSFAADLSIKNCRMSGLTLKDVLLQGRYKKIAAGGKISEETASLCDFYGVKLYNVTDDDAFAVANAVPTAEAAIMTAMEELPVCLFGLEVLVTGYGRVARVLVSRLLALTANVTVAARKAFDRAYACADGCEAVDISDLSELELKKYRLIYNTVPARILDSAAADRMDGSVLVIDLASLPGGCDDESLNERGIRVIHALSLPGKYAPKTAGEILAFCVMHIVSEEEKN